MSSSFRRVCVRFAVFMFLTSSELALGQSSNGCDQPTSGSGLILGRALQEDSYKGKRASIGIENVDLRSVRALTDPDGSAACDSLRQMLKGWPGRAANTQLHFFVADGVYFVTVEQIRRKAEDPETVPPQLVVIRDKRIATMFVKRH